MMVISRAFIVFLFVVAINIIGVASITAQATALSPSCVPDALDPNRNILEITGNLENNFIDITSSINNCHIYIHDLTVPSIKFSSQIMNNSNITIRNVSSSDKSIATFIWFAESITNFSFINISNVSHSALSIDSSTGNAWISIVAFNNTVTGKSHDMTSWINIAGLTMNNVVCDRSADSSTVCTTAMVYFESAIYSLARFEVSNFAMHNISMDSKTSLLSSMSATYFDTSVASQVISINNFVVRNVKVRNTVGPSDLVLLKFLSTVTALVESDSSSSFTVRDFSVDRGVAHSDQGTCTSRLLSVNGAVSGFNNIQLRNISASSLSSTSLSTASSVYVAFFGNSLTADSSTSKFSSFAVDGVRFQNCSSTGGTTAQIILFTAEEMLTNFSEITLSNCSAMQLNASSSLGTASLAMFQFASSVNTSSSSSSQVSCTNVASASSSSFVLKNMLLDAASATGTSASMMLFRVSSALGNYETIQFSAVKASSISAKGTSGSGAIYLAYFASSVTASANACTTLLLLDDILLRNTSSTGPTATQLWIVFVGGVVTGYNTIQITNLVAVDVNSASSGGSSSFYVVAFGSSVTTTSMISSSSLSVDSIRVQNVSSAGGASQLWMFFVKGAVKGFNTIQIKRFSGASLKSVSNGGAASIYFADFSSSVTASVMPSFASSISVDSIRANNVSTFSVSGETQLWIFVVKGAVNAYNKIQITNVDGLSLNSASNAGAASSYFVDFSSSVTAPATSPNPSSILLDSIRVNNVSSFGGGGRSQLWIFAVIGAVNGFNTIQISNVDTVSLSSASTTGTSAHYFVYFGSSVTAPATSSLASSFLVDSIQIQNASSVGGSGESQLWIFFAKGNMNGFHSIHIKNVGAASLNAVSTAGNSSQYFVYFGSSVTATSTAPSSSSPSALLFENITMQSVRSTAMAEAQLWMLFVKSGVSNYGKIRCTNITAMSLAATSTSDMSTVYLLHFATLTATPDTTSTLTVANVRLDGVESTSFKYSRVWMFYVGGAVANYHALHFFQISAESLNSTSLAGTSSVNLVCFDSSVTGPDNPLLASSSSILVEDVSLRNVSSTATSALSSTTSSEIYFASFVEAVSSFSNIKFTNLTATSLSSTSVYSMSVVYLLYFLSPVTGPVSSGFFSSASSFLVDNIQFDGASAVAGVGSDSSVGLLWAIDIVSGFNSIQITNVSASGIRSVATSGVAILLLFWFSSVSSSIVSSSAPLLVFANILLENTTSIAKEKSVIYTVELDFVTYYSIQFSNIFTSNASVSSSISVSTISTVFFFTLSNCSSLQFQQLQMKNISASSNSASKISVLRFDADGTYENISRLSVQNSGIAQTSGSGPSIGIRIFDAGGTASLQAASIIIENNYLMLMSSNVPLDSPAVSVAVVGLTSTSSGFTSMEIKNNILRIDDQNWQNICSATNCSMVRVDGIQAQQGNNNDPSTIIISESEVTPTSSSFISFSNFSDINSNVHLHFVLENNKANFTDATSVSSLLGLDSSSPITSPFPSDATVEVKCNEWPRIIDRSYEKHLLTAASSSKVQNFISWTCHSPSVSQTRSPSADSIRDSTHTRTRRSTVSTSASSSSSPTALRTSVSSFPTQSKSSEITVTKSSSKSEDDSTTASLSSSFSASIPVPPHRSPLRAVYDTATTVTSLLSVATMSSTAAITAVRSRSALHHFSALLSGNCGLDEETLSSQEEERADLSSSPTTMKLSDGGYLTGLVVGNICFVVGIGIAWFAGNSIIREIERRKETMKETKIEQKKDAKKKQDKKKTKQEKKSKKKDKHDFLRTLIDSNVHQMMLLFAILLLEPTLTAGATSFLGGIIVRERRISAVPIICVFLAWILLLIVGLMFPIWSLVYRRSDRYDEFEENKKTKSDSSCKLSPRWFVHYMTDASGEWIFLGEKEKHKLRFKLAVVFFEWYSPSFPKFIIVDILIVVCLSLAEVIGYIIGSGATACIVRGAIVCVAFSVHILCMIYFRPVYTDRASNTLVAVVEVISVTMIAGAMSVTGKTDDVAQIEVWSAVALTQSILQSLVMSLELAAVALPIWDKILIKLKLKSGKSKQNESETSASVVCLPELMLIRNNIRDNQKTCRDAKNFARCEMLDQEIQLLERESKKGFVHRKLPIHKKKEQAAKQLLEIEKRPTL